MTTAEVLTEIITFSFSNGLNEWSFVPSHVPRLKCEIFKISLLDHQKHYFTSLWIYKTQL